MKNQQHQVDTETGLPILRGHISHNSSTCCQIAVYCPYCRSLHHHGWPDRTTDPDHLEHRYCHCYDTLNRGRKDSPYSNNGYLIAVKPIG